MKRAFTLVELLMVIAIILVLAGLLLAAGSVVREQARAAVTETRINGIIQGFATTFRSGGRGVAVAVQEKAALGGVLRFRGKTSAESWTELTSGGAGEDLALSVPLTGTWLDPVPPHHFAAPWEQAAAPGTASEPDIDPATRLSTVSLDRLSTAKSADLLALSGVVEDGQAATVRGDRGRNRPWNDAWGHPLVVAYGLFQPVTAADLREAQQRYGYTRGLYLAVAAAGPEIADAAVRDDLALPVPAAWDADMAALWTQACTVAGASAWTGAAFAQPPWKGVRRVKGAYNGGSVKVFLSEPATQR
jgi:prepilin-type N-terminal cleavage/methylation domain-containing protein